MSALLNFGIIPASFGLIYTLLSFWSFNVHNSNLNYKHMLPCTKVGWKITFVSSGEFLLPPSIYIGPNAFFEANFDQTLEQ